MEQTLYDAVKFGNEEVVKRILLENPDLNVNLPLVNGWAALHLACFNRHDKIVSLLLTHPRIDVNQRKLDGYTPFQVACCRNQNACARVLLKDARVDPNIRDGEGCTPLFWLATWGFRETIQDWIASGKEMDFGEPGSPTTDAIRAARSGNLLGTVSLLERARDHPEETRHEVRLQLGWLEEEAADLFAQAVFLSDGLLEINRGGASNAVRFHEMARRLPVELQMVLCYRVVGYAREIIPGESREAAFRALTKVLLRSVR